MYSFYYCSTLRESSIEKKTFINQIQPQSVAALGVIFKSEPFPVFCRWQKTGKEREATT